MPEHEAFPSPDLWAVLEFHDIASGKTFGVSLATLLQCLCIAEQRHVVPPFEADWETIAIPKVLREMSAISAS